ncbi:MAG: TROVE domain-containing protein, partial [Eubacteriales bacterium]
MICKVTRQDPDFVSRLAVYARRVFNMRSVAHVLAAYLAHEPEGKPFVRRTIGGITLRGDDVTELMAFYLSTFGKPIPNALRKGVNDVFARFDEYTLAKYRGGGKAVRMRDIVMLCHPRPKDEAQAALWKRLLEDDLKTPVTWETQLSANGNNKRTWEALIDSGRVGYMALLRNLRNILQAAPDNIDKVWQTIANPDAVRHSRQLPFRYLSAYREIGSAAGSKALDALESAVRLSVSNLPRLPGTTVIAVDTSGSMGWRLSDKSSVRCCEVGMMLGLIANRICENSLFYTFDVSIEKYPLTSHAAILETCTRTAKAGFGTRMGLPFETMMNDGIKADRIIIISDNECNQ